MKKYLVETVSVFRIRYVIECEDSVHATDSVVMNEVEEFSQEHIDENIFSVREINDDEIVSIFFEDHPYLKEYGPEKAMQYVHKIDYDEK